MEALATSCNDARIQPYNFKSMVRLALGTSWLIATSLTIPDAISISPNCPDLTVLSLRIIGLWISAYIQWFLAFLLILKTASIVNRGVVVDGKGLKLSRLSKAIPWSNLVGVTAEASPFVSRLLLFDKPALRINLYARDEKGKISQKQLDSLLFSESEFRQLFQVICARAFNMSSNGEQVFLSQTTFKDQLRNGHQGAERKRKLFVAYIGLMLVLFMGKTCGRNYYFNQAGISFNKQDYGQAIELCRQSLWFDPAFAFAWDRMARAEFRMDDWKSAEAHFLKALQNKPDLVSSKVGLSNIYLRQNRLADAQSLLEQASRLNPRDIPTLLNMGAMRFKTGKTTEAVACFEKALKLAPDNSNVKVVASEAYLKCGRTAEAESLLKNVREEEVEPAKSALLERLRQLLAKGAQRG